MNYRLGDHGRRDVGLSPFGVFEDELEDAYDEV